MAAGMDALFAAVVVGGDGDGGVVSSSAFGVAAEHEVIAMLLRRGHKVAVPVVDDDGVDLVVDYRTTVQVKVTSQRNAHGVPHLQLKRNSYRRRLDGTRVARPQRLAEHVDVLTVFVVGVGWYVVPRAAVTPSGIVFGPRVEQWREAWDVFEGFRRAA